MTLQAWGFLASVACALISAWAAWATHRSAANATVEVAKTTTRGDLEQQAFERAEAFYTNVIARQDREIADQAADIDRLEKALASVKERTEMCEADCHEMRRERGYWIRTAQQLARAVQRLRQHIDPDRQDPTLVELDETVLRVLNENL